MRRLVKSLLVWFALAATALAQVDVYEFPDFQGYSTYVAPDGNGRMIGFEAGNYMPVQMDLDGSMSSMGTTELGTLHPVEQGDLGFSARYAPDGGYFATWVSNSPTADPSGLAAWLYDSSNVTSAIPVDFVMAGNGAVRHQAVHATSNGGAPECRMER